MPFLLSVFHFPLSFLYSQNLMYPFEHYNDQNGLSAPVKKIIQDDFGFIWLGTSDGLHRFDGRNFKVFRNKIGDTNSISNNIINDLCIHPNGQIWIASNGGVCYFNYEDGRFHQVMLPENLENTDRYRVHCLAIDEYGQVWFATKTKFHVLDHKYKLLSSFSLPLNYVYTISELHSIASGKLFIGTNTGDLIKFETCLGIMSIVKIQSKESEELNLQATITGVFPFAKDSLYITSWYGGVHKLYCKEDTMQAVHIPYDEEQDLQKNVVTGLGKLNSGDYWVVTHGAGITLLDPNLDRYKGFIKYNLSNPNGLSNNYLNDIFIDRNGIVWIGSDDGLNKYDMLSNQFFSIRIPQQENEVSVYRRPSCIIEDKHAADGKFLWIAIPGVGILHYDRKSHLFESVSMSGEQDQRIYDMMYNNEGQLMFCSNSGIYTIDATTNKIEPYKFPGDFNLEGVRKLMMDSKGNYWFTLASKGVCCFIQQTKKWIFYSNNPDDPNSLPDNSVFRIMEDHDGFIWIGMQNKGLSRLNPDNGSFVNFEHHKLQSRTLPDNNVYDMYEDAEHYLWVATENGLARLNPARNAFKVFTTSEGLSNNDIFSITADHEGKLWLGTNHGLSVLNPKDGSIINYSQMDGLPSNRMDGAVLCCADRFLYFSSNGMLSGCNPVAILKNHAPPFVAINSVKVRGEEVILYRSGKDLQEIKLSYSNNNFSPEFIALNFTNSAKNKYAYFLEGYDAHWNYCGSQTSTTYTNLPGGEYTFKVKAANNDGVWSTMSDQLKIIVQPPFWKAWWFYVLTIGGLLFIIYTFFRIKINQLLHLQQLRLDIARDLHDDVGSTLSSINMTSSMANRLVKSGKDQIDLFHTIQSASGKAMEMMNEIVWSIKPENDKPEMMISRMRQYASEILEPAGIDFQFNIQEKSYQGLIPLNIRRDLFMIFKEALNNLAKYSQAKESKINMEFDRGELKLIIEDNGVGFDVNQTPRGNGLKNMEERAKTIGAKYKLVSTPGTGTRIELYFKF
jgi:ligand-binding sensor domain-containing protein/two-component sensor histidine kinase